MNIETAGGQVRAITIAQLETDAHVRSLARHMTDVMDTINRLGHAVDHDERLDRLESN